MNYQKTKFERTKGITLIALVITIIILLILAGVTIATLSGSNGILTNAIKSKGETIIGQEKEQISLAQSSAILKDGVDFTTNEFRNELKKLAGEDKVTVTDAKDNEGEHVIKIHYKDTDHYYHIKNGHINELDDSYYAKKDITEVWAIYYPNGENSELVFNTTGNIDNSKVTTDEIKKWEVSRTNFASTSSEWSSYAASINTVTFEEEVVPEYTAKWFSGFSKLANIKNIENLNTSRVTNMRSMFMSCKALVTLDLSNFDTSNVTDMQAMFANCNALTNLDLSSFDTSGVTNMYWMFMNCKALTNLNLSTFDTSNVTTMQAMFSNCNSLTNLDLNSFDTSNVTIMSAMFSNCYSLTDLDLSSFNTSSVTRMSGMFSYCNSLTDLDLSSFDTSSVTNMSSMFANCSALTSLNLSSFNTSSVTTMQAMFMDCSALTSLDLSNFDTNNVTTMSFMFGSPENGSQKNMNLKEIKGLENFDTSNVTTMNSMFQYCRYLPNLDFTGWDTTKVEDMSYMFFACQGLTEIKVGENWKTASENISMFGGSCGVSDVVYSTGI